MNSRLYILIASLCFVVGTILGLFHVPLIACAIVGGLIGVVMAQLAILRRKGAA